MKKLVPNDYKFKSEFFEINDTFIPKCIAERIRLNDNEELKSFDEKSIFNWIIYDETPFIFMFNPFTNQLLMGTGNLYAALYENNVVNELGNPFDNFVRGALFYGADNTKNPNKVVFPFHNIKQMKSELTSMEIVATLEMLKRNGALDDTIIKMYKTTTWSLKYFMKTKVLW